MHCSMTAGRYLRLNCLVLFLFGALCQIQSTFGWEIFPGMQPREATFLSILCLVLLFIFLFGSLTLDLRDRVRRLEEIVKQSQSADGAVENGTDMSSESNY